MQKETAGVHRSAPSPAVSSPHGPRASGSTVAPAVMRLVAEHAAQALDELMDLQTSGNADAFAAQSSVVKTESAGADEVPSVASSEAERILLRVRRLRAIVRLVEQETAIGRQVDDDGVVLARADSPDGSSRAVGGADHSLLRTPRAAAAGAVQCLHDCFAAMSGTAQPMGTASLPLSRARPAVGLPEAALSVYSANTRTVFRRRAPPSDAPGPAPATALKRAREEGQAAQPQQYAGPPGPSPPSIFAAIRSDQHRQRFGLYASRVALLPRSDAHAVMLSRAAAQASQEGARGAPTATAAPPRAAAGRGCLDEVATSAFRPYISPAVRQLAALNLSAQYRMLAHTWAIHTKAALLAELPGLHSAVAEMYSELSAQHLTPPSGQSDRVQGANVRSASTADASSALSMPFFSFLSTEDGAVRVSVQSALLLDATYSFPAREWRLLRLHWRLRAPLLSVVANDDELVQVVTVEQRADAAPEGDELPTLDASLERRYLVPNHQDAMHRYVQSVLTEGGLAAGLLAANRLVNAVALDALAHQARRLRDSTFVSLLKDTLAVEVRPGLHVSLMARAPAATAAQHRILHRGTFAERDERDAHAQLLLKFRLAGGTVVEETAWTGGAGESQGMGPLTTVRRVLLPADATAASGSAGVDLSVEDRLWEAVLRYS